MHHSFASVAYGFLICAALVAVFWLFLGLVLKVVGDLLSLVLSGILAIPFSIWMLSGSHLAWPVHILLCALLAYVALLLIFYAGIGTGYLMVKIFGVKGGS